MNKYEQLIEHIINDEQDKARAIFHNIVVEKSRDIYEDLMDEEGYIGGNKVEDLADEVTMDEEGLSEEGDEDEDLALVGGDEDETVSDFDVDGEEGGDEFGGEEGGEGGIEDRVVDLEAALDELKAEFDALMAGESEEEEHADMFGGEEELGAGGDELGGDEYSNEMGDEIVREYVEKVGDTGQKSEGGEVGAGKRVSVNTKTPVAGKNDMGGSAKNIASGKPGSDVTAAKAQKMNTGNINVPGGKAGSAFKSKESAASGEGQTTGGKVSVATKSILKKA